MTSSDDNAHVSDRTPGCTPSPHNPVDHLCVTWVIAVITVNEWTRGCRAGTRDVVEESTITAIRKTVTAAGCAAVLLATAAACGTVQNLTAGQKVDHAVDRLGEQK